MAAKRRPRAARIGTALLIGLTLAASAYASDGRIVQEVIHSAALEGNLLEDPADRPLIVYLPPGYDASPAARYPVVYLLHGSTESPARWLSSEFDVKTVMDRLVAEGAVGEMIFVMIDGRNRFKGSWYRSSQTIGDYEGYITREAVDFVDAHYRTIPDRSGRGIAGFSMGGYGAIHLALAYPETYGAVVVHAGHYDRDASWKGRLEQAAQANLVDWAGYSSLGFLGQSGFAIAAGISPNPGKAPFYVDLPFAMVDGELREVPEVWSLYAEADIVHGHLDRYLGQPERLRGMMLIHGVNDGLAPIGHARTLDEALTSRGIEHVYLEHGGGHQILTDGPERWLGFLSDHLAREGGGARLPGVSFEQPPSVAMLAGETRPVDLRLELEPPPSTLGLTRLEVDLSAVGGPAAAPVGDATAREQRIQLDVGPLANGLYRLPVRVTGDDGRAYLLFDIEVSAFPRSDLVILDEGVGSGWRVEGARGVEAVDAVAGEVAFAGQTAARIHGKKSFAGWSVPFAAGEAVSTFGYAALRFAFAPGEAEVAANDRFTVSLSPGKAVGLRDRVDFTRAEWQMVEIPLESFEAADAIAAVTFSGNFGGVVFIDDLRLVAVEAALTPTAVAEEQGDSRPQDFALLQNYPNPCNSGTTIDYRLPATGEVELAVFDLAGQLVATLVRGPRSAGSHRVQWDGRGEAGRGLASGMYLYRLTSGAQVRERKLLLLK